MYRSTKCISSRFTAMFVSRSTPWAFLAPAHGAAREAALNVLSAAFLAASCCRVFLIVSLEGRYTSASFGKPSRSDAIRTALGHHPADPGDRSFRQRAAGGERPSGDAGTPPHARGVARVSDCLRGTAGVFVRRSCLSGLDAPVGNLAVDRGRSDFVSDLAANGVLASR